MAIGLFSQTGAFSSGLGSRPSSRPMAVVGFVCLVLDPDYSVGDRDFSSHVNWKMSGGSLVPC
jgi:hypothetical protein